MGTNDRYQVMAQPVAAPGTCIICRSNRRGPFVDTKVNDEWLGVFYICNGCVNDMYIALGNSADERDTDHALKVNEAYEQGLIEGTRRFKEALSNVISDYMGLTVSTVSFDSISEPAAAIEPATVQDDSPGEAGSGDSTDRSSKQGTRVIEQQGRNNVPGDSGDGLPDLNI